MTKGAAAATPARTHRGSVYARTDGASRPFLSTRFDLILALCAVAAVLVEAALRAPGSTSLVAYLLALLAGGPLIWRASMPLATLLAVAAGSVLCAAVLDANWTVTAITGLALFNVALLGDRRRSLLVGVLTATAVAAAVLAIGATVEAGSLITRVVLVGACAVAGELVRSREELQDERRERAARDAREREEQLHQRAVAERMAIARELHDTLAHALVAINVRASVAVDLPERQDPAAALADIKNASADALRDLRSTLSVLRDPDDLAPTVPAQGFEALDPLIRAASAAGIETVLRLDVDPGAVPAATTAATLRIVQESLTNVIRHAHAQHAAVVVRADAEVLHVVVTDDGDGANGPRTGGLGVQGMVERATALGGELQAGPAAGGGWSVHAHLSLNSEALG